MAVVLDASALLAYLREEPGAEVVDGLLADAHMASVNWAEVVQKGRDPLSGVKPEARFP